MQAIHEERRRLAGEDKKENQENVGPGEKRGLNDSIEPDNQQCKRAKVTAVDLEETSS